MSLYPYNHPVFRTGDWWDASTLGRLFDQNFASSVLDNDPFFSRASQPSLMPYWLRSRTAPIVPSLERGLSEVATDTEKFTVNLDISHFQPEEVKVKVVDNNLIIEGKHEEKMDQHGFVSRSFTRRYVLPKDVDMAALTSQLNTNGMLHIEAPRTVVEKPGERSIPIQLAGSNKPAIKERPVNRENSS